MLSGLVAAVALLTLMSLPWWLPEGILALRSRIFTASNGFEGLAVPGPLVDVSLFRHLYAHQAASGRSRGAVLSDLFWYWLSPGAEIHQEHLEPGQTYEAVARTTRSILAIPRQKAEELAARCVARQLAREPVGAARLARLRDLMMPVWAEFYYELVFKETCPAEARELIVTNAHDVVTALKCCGLRHMDRREALTRYLIARLEAGAIPHTLPAQFSMRERALYLQGTFFNTAVVQMAEAMSHLLMAVAQHPGVQRRLRFGTDRHYFDHVIDETLRVYPLFGISHRITRADITLGDRTVPRGTVLCFNHLDYQRSGFADPDRFDPDRWERHAAHAASYIPFGVAANRPCPASGIASVTMRACLREVLRHVALSTSAAHTRSLPNRAPCVIHSRTQRPPAHRLSTLLLWLRVRDRWEDVWRSVVQLVLGTYMIWDARRLALCTRHFQRFPDSTDASDATQQTAQPPPCSTSSLCGDTSAVPPAALLCPAGRADGATLSGHQHLRE